MAQPPTILINGKPVVVPVHPSSSLRPEMGSEDDWTMAPLATIFERFLAKGADGIFSSLLAVMLNILSIPETPGYLFYLFLQIYMIQSPLKATPGKWLMGLRLVSTREGSVNTARAMLRIAVEMGLPFLIGVIGQVLLLIPGMKLFAVIAMIAIIALYFRPLFHPRRHAWHDTIAGTEVVRITPSRVRHAITVFAVLFIVIWKYQEPIRARLELMAEKEAKTKALRVFAFQPADGKSENPCQRTKYCLTAYVTPWCPACEQTKPTLKRLQSVFNDGSVGIQVIMGQDQPAKLQAACADYGSGCGLDTDETVLKNLKIQIFPTYLVWETSSRKLIKKPRAFKASETLNPEEFKRFASEKLGIPSL